LTKHDTSSSASGRDRPVEIEITPQMIEAGVEVLRVWLDDDRPMGQDTQLVRELCEAVLKGRP
jgi:hypothetical protein